jgi:hypothetical protein
MTNVTIDNSVTREMEKRRNRKSPRCNELGQDGKIRPHDRFSRVYFRVFIAIVRNAFKAVRRLRQLSDLVGKEFTDAIGN